MLSFVASSSHIVKLVNVGVAASSRLNDVGSPAFLFQSCYATT